MTALRRAPSGALEVVVPSSAELAGLRSAYEEAQWVRLPDFLSRDLRDDIIDAVDAARFEALEIPAVRLPDGQPKKEFVMERNSVGALLLLAMNDPRLFNAIEAITGCDRIVSFQCRTYRHDPKAGHIGGWHNDMKRGRMVALSLNLGREPFEGGELELRNAQTEEIVDRISNPAAGDAFIFRIDRSLEHRVAPMHGIVPRTAFAGWFCSEGSTPLVA